MSDPNKPQKAAQHPESATQNPPSSTLPSSHGESPKEMVPKDISPKDASWADRSERKITSSNADEHREALHDEAVDETFPASDPIAERPDPTASQQSAMATPDEEEEQLDDAIEMTFPASDPIAIPSSEEMSHERDLRQGHTGQAVPPSR